MRDVLGRPVRSAEPEPPRRPLLTDGEIAAIAYNVRTRPLAEVGRHVMPLVQHIGVQDDELERLRAVNAELLAALKGLGYEADDQPEGVTRYCDHAAEPCHRCQAARAAVRNAERKDGA